MKWAARVALAGVLMLSAGCGDTSTSDAAARAKRLADSIGSQSKDQIGLDGQPPSVEAPRTQPGKEPEGGALAVAALEPRTVVQFAVADLGQPAPGSGLRAVRSSRPVGAVYQLVPAPDGGYLASTSDGANVVRLTSDLAVAAVQPLAQALQAPASDVRVGALVVSGPELVAVVATGTRLVLLRLNARTLQVVDSANFPDRFAGYPPACMLASGDLVVAATGFVDAYDPRALRRVRTLRRTDSGALACNGDAVAVARADSPRLDLLSSTGALRGDAVYTGQPATGLLGLRDGGWLVLDGFSGTAVLCANTGRCATPRRVGRKPNGAAQLTDESIVVTAEKGQSLHVLSPELDRSRVYELDFSPRAPFSPGG